MDGIMDRISHIGIYVSDLEKVRTFFEDYFMAVSGSMYHNHNSGLSTYFLTFDNGSQLELLNRPHSETCSANALFHLAISVGSKSKVDEKTVLLKRDGYHVLDGPRKTGDGYYESCIEGPEGLNIEITV